MPPLTKEFQNQALELSPVDRVSLAEKLLSSLDAPRDAVIDEKWAAESEDRIQAYEAGSIHSTDASAVFERLEKKYNR